MVKSDLVVGVIATRPHNPYCLTHIRVFASSTGSRSTSIWIEGMALSLCRRIIPAGFELDTMDL